MNRDMSKMDVLKKICELNFMVEDLSLYLDTHPMDKNALSKYNYFAAQYDELKRNYEKHFGMLSDNSVCNAYQWQWIAEPWPWEKDANFELKKEEM